MPAREFNLKAYAAMITMIRPSLGLESRLADHRSQAARTATLSTAPPRQATCAKSHKNWWMCVKAIASQTWDVCVYTQSNYVVCMGAYLTTFVFNLKVSKSISTGKLHVFPTRGQLVSKPKSIAYLKSI